MLISKNNLSVIIVNFESENVIYKCIDTIDKSIDILVIDNSNNKSFKKKIEKKYKNVKCLVSTNVGMGAGNNIGIRHVKKDFVFILNPDVILKKNTIEEIIKASRIIDNFSILSPISDKKSFPNYKFKKDKVNKVSTTKPFKVDVIDGYSMLLNLKRLKKIPKFKFFDENFFLYLENDDFCKRVREKQENIYIVPKSKIHHLGGKAVSSKFKNEIELSRNWHWMWSKFYYNKKHYGFLVAFFAIFKNLISSIIKFTYYLIIFDKQKKKIYQMRLSGIIHSIISSKSFYRPKLFND
jgi:N-acetylglucosaminyl-diphospho-decaprenol L-rhamnosyltransferase